MTFVQQQEQAQQQAKEATQQLTNSLNTLTPQPLSRTAPKQVTEPSLAFVPVFTNASDAFKVGVSALEALKEHGTFHAARVNGAASRQNLQF